LIKQKKVFIKPQSILKMSFWLYLMSFWHFEDAIWYFTGEKRFSLS
jgi:hypothetical protein